MMTLNEFSNHLHNIGPHHGCICLECTKCKKKMFWYEGSIQSLYEKLYLKGCRFCNGAYVVFGYDGEDAEL